MLIRRSALGVGRLLLYLVAGARQAGLFPGAEAAGERTNIFVSHLLQTLRNERRSAPAAAIANDWFFQIGNVVLDLQLDVAAAEMGRSFRVVIAPIVFFADVDQNGFAALGLLSSVSRRNLGDMLFRLRDEFLKTVRL